MLVSNDDLGNGVCCASAHTLARLIQFSGHLKLCFVSIKSIEFIKIQQDYSETVASLFSNNCRSVGLITPKRSAASNARWASFMAPSR